MIDVYLSTLSIVSNTGVHAAGLYRAAHGYGFLKISRNPVMEDFNYLNVCTVCIGLTPTANWRVCMYVFACKQLH